MTIDPRRILEEAASRRATCEVLPKGGHWTRGAVVRVEKGGVVLSTPDHRFEGGEDVRVWIALDDKPYTFEANVIRAGVPLPDRSRNGTLLGFIDRWAEGTPPAKAEADRPRLIQIVPPHGPAISLLDPPVNLVELSVDELAFTTPSDYKLIFVEAGTVTVRMAADNLETVDATARVRTLTPSEGFLLYALFFENVADPEAFRRVVHALRT